MQTNLEESERDTEEWGNSKQEKDANQPKQNKELVPKKGAPSVARMWFGYESLTRSKKKMLLHKIKPHTGSHNRLKYP